MARWADGADCGIRSNRTQIRSQVHGKRVPRPQRKRRKLAEARTSLGGGGGAPPGNDANTEPVGRRLVVSSLSRSQGLHRSQPNLSQRGCTSNHFRTRFYTGNNAGWRKHCHQAGSAVSGRSKSKVDGTPPLFHQDVALATHPLGA